MNKFNRRPKQVEAIQWTPGVTVPLAVESPSGAVFVNSQAGKTSLLPGDYVIISEPGGHIVMSAADFEGEYEPASKPKAVKPEPKPAPKPKAAKKVAKKKAAKKK